MLSLSIVGIISIFSIYNDTFGSGVKEKTVAVEKVWKKSSRYDRNRYVIFKNDPEQYKTYYGQFISGKIYKVQYLHKIIFNASLLNK